MNNGKIFPGQVFCEQLLSGNFRLYIPLYQSRNPIHDSFLERWANLETYIGFHSQDHYFMKFKIKSANYIAYSSILVT